MEAISKFNDSLDGPESGPGLVCLQHMHSNKLGLSLFARVNNLKLQNAKYIKRSQQT
jgi:hypothetical protein